jgi:hypothetical protein
MPTNLAIDDELLAEALRVGGRRTKRETVNEALAEYVRRRKRRNFAKLFAVPLYSPPLPCLRRNAGTSRSIRPPPPAAAALGLGVFR